MKEYITNAHMTPTIVSAGDSVEISICLIVGKDFQTPGSCLVYDLPAMLGYSRPSCYDQEDDGYAVVFCSNPDVKYVKKVFDMEYQRFGNKNNASYKGMSQRLFVIEFTEGKLHAGDEIIFKWGYIRNGFGTGTKVTTIVPMPDYENIIHIRYFTDLTKALPDLGRDIKGMRRPVPQMEAPLKLKIIPREPEKIRIIRQGGKTKVLVLDRFSNICPVTDMNVHLEGDFEGHFNEYGVYEIADAAVQLFSKGLPMSDSPTMNDVYKGMSIYFGDLHTHSSTSNDVIEREKMMMTPTLSFEYAKHVSSLDFLAITDHHQPWDEERNKIGKEKWEELHEAVKKHDVEGHFLAFEGFENRCMRGDTTVVFHDPVDYDEIDDASLVDIRSLWDKFEGTDYISMFHFHNPGTLGNNEWFQCPYEGVEPVLELFSCHGSYEGESVLEHHIPEIKAFRKDRNAQYFLNEGYVYGLTCNSDNHKGNVGNNGLTAVYASKLDKKSILDAIRKRHVYGTTNARIRLLFTMNGELMGTVFPQSEMIRTLYISVTGEGILKAVDIIKNGVLYQRYKPDAIAFEQQICIEETGFAYYYVRVTQVDNHIAYSSPIWFK